MKHKEDRERLVHMKQAIDKIMKYTEEVDFIEFEKNEMLQDAIFKNLEIIGEAAYKITNETKTLHPNIEWRKIEGLRHRLVHDYCKVDLELVWQMKHKSLPALLRDITSILSQDS